MGIGLRCEICNHKEKTNLKNHLQEVHKMTTKEYRAEYPKSRLMTAHSRRTIEYWYYRGYSLEESKNKVREYQTSHSIKNEQKLANGGLSPEEIKELIREKGRESSLRHPNYYKKRGYSEEEALKMAKEYQSKQSAKSRKFKGGKHTEESKKKMSIASKKLIKKKGVNKWVSHFYQGKKGLSSKVEEMCFIEVKKIVPDLEANYPYKGKFLDMRTKNIAIEFYGDFWHRNPKIYTKDFTKSKVATEDIWKKDEERVNFLLGEGFRVCIIWESSWRKYKGEVIEKVKSFVYDSQEKTTEV